VINQRHNHVDAASLGLAICDCKERQVCQLTYAPNTIGKLHAFSETQIYFLKSRSIIKISNSPAVIREQTIATL
jgi:hypothetical protein